MTETPYNMIMRLARLRQTMTNDDTSPDDSELRKRFIERYWIADDAAEWITIAAAREAALRDALEDIASPSRLQTGGDPTVLRDRAREALEVNQ